MSDEKTQEEQFQPMHAGDAHPWQKLKLGEDHWAIGTHDGEDGICEVSKVIEADLDLICQAPVMAAQLRGMQPKLREAEALYQKLSAEIGPLRESDRQARKDRDSAYRQRDEAEAEVERLRKFRAAWEEMRAWMWDINRPILKEWEHKHGLSPDAGDGEAAVDASRADDSEAVKPAVGLQAGQVWEGGPFVRPKYRHIFSVSKTLVWQLEDREMVIVNRSEVEDWIRKGPARCIAGPEGGES